MAVRVSGTRREYALPFIKMSACNYPQSAYNSAYNCGMLRQCGHLQQQ